jgi:hypothetical protein
MPHKIIERTDGMDGGDVTVYKKYMMEWQYDNWKAWKKRTQEYVPFPKGTISRYLWKTSFDGIKWKTIIRGLVQEEVDAEAEKWIKRIDDIPTLGSPDADDEDPVPIVPKKIKRKKEAMPEKPDIKDAPFKLVLPESGGVTVCLLGASRSGKTTLMKHIINEYFEKQIILFTSLNDHADIYKSGIPKRTIISNEFHPELIKDCYTLNHLTNNKFKTLHVFDDAIGDKMKMNPQITKLFTIYRNCAQSTIYSAQSSTLVSPVGRSNANYVCLFHLNASKEIESTVKDFLVSHLPTKMKLTEKIQYFNEATADHCFLMIDNINNTIVRCKLTPEQCDS